MIELSLNNIEKFYGANKILENVTFDVKSGERLGIIGRNGTGKTTIFKIIQGIETYNGTLSIKKGNTIGYLDQIPDKYLELTVESTLYTAFSDILDIREEMKIVEVEMSNNNENIDNLVKKYGNLQNKYETLGGYEIDENIGKICSGLKIDNEFKKREFKTLSGGEKTTVLLAKILLQNPDILLLDEPTNHLDLESIEWLEEFLKEYKGTVLIISHDRYFLDKVVSRIVEIEFGKVNTYHGNYSYYLEEKERRFLQNLSEYKIQQKSIDKMEEAIKRYRIWGSEKMYRKAKILERKLEKVDRIDKPFKDESKMKINLDSSRSGKEVIRINKLNKSFDENIILKDLHFNVYYGERICILGKNGSGKSTLLKILLNQHSKDSGEINIGSNVKIGYLEQIITFEAEEMTILDSIVDSFNISQEDARKMLANFMFIKDDVFKKIKNLSGGEKSRLKLCFLMNQDINLLILDEPTNHLDINSREVLEETLLEFEGTIVFISHDRFFINRISRRIVELNNRKFDNYLGNYDYYKNKKIEKVQEMEFNEFKKEEKNETKKKGKVIDANMRIEKENKKIEKQIKKTEEEIELHEKMLCNKDDEMKNYSSDYNRLNEIFEEKKEIQQKLDLFIEKWTKLQEGLL